MRAFINAARLSKFMQAADIFSSNKVVFSEVDLYYESGGKPILDEDMISVLALIEFKKNLIVLFGKEKPLYINPAIQVLSTGREWVRLIDIVTRTYPTLKFRHDDRYMKIEVA